MTFLRGHLRPLPFADAGRLVGAWPALRRE